MILWGLGVTEAAHGTVALLGALQSMQDGMMAPMVNLERPIAQLAGMPPRSRAESTEVRRALAYSLAPEGTMTAVAVERV